MPLCGRARRTETPLGESPAFFGVKPDLIVKGGSIVAAAMGDANASIPTPQPVHYRPMFGAFGKRLTASSFVFVSKAAIAKGLRDQFGIEKELIAVENARRGISKKSMAHDARRQGLKSTRLFEVPEHVPYGALILAAG